MNAEQLYYISKDQFQKLRVDFVKHLDDIGSFLDEALANGLLTKSNRETIMSERDSRNQNRRLHDILYKKLPDGSSKFVSALEKSEHNEILKLLDDPLVYPMKFKPHGRVILINNVKFDDEVAYNERHGSEKDVEAIMKLFKAFNFDVELYSDKKAEEMKIIIERASEKSTASEDCFVMFLMSHGTQGNIVGIDGEKLPYSIINTILKSTQLNDKPKLIYINTYQIKSNKNNVANDTDACPTNKNTCQSKPQVKEDAECSKGGETNSEKEDVKQYFNVPHLYVTFATVPESKAFRTEESGSVFIKSLLTVYERNKEKFSCLLDLLFCFILLYSSP
ncbi:caspase-7-like [Octopus bimaculoides]|nr:caspase-7-like [Octopus bimaculoides]